MTSRFEEAGLGGTFAWYLGALAFFEILFLWLLIVWTLVLFWHRSVAAGVLWVRT